VYNDTVTSIQDAASWGYDSGTGYIKVDTTPSAPYSYPLEVILVNASNDSIYASGNIIANSDISTKTNIQTIENALEKVLQLRGVTYTRTDLENKDKVDLGLIAQEVLPILPEVVSQKPDGKLALAYQNIVGLLVEAIKDQNVLIQKLQSDLDQIKKDLNK
jgi:hypothetical protein